MSARAPHNCRYALVPAWARHTLNYGIIGAFCACASNVVIIACSLVDIEYWNAVALSFVLVTPLGYVLQSRFTFRVGLTILHFIRFAISAAAGAFLFLILVSLFCSVLGMAVWLASPLATGLVFCWNYTASRWAIYHHTSPGAGPSSLTV